MRKVRWLACAMTALWGRGWARGGTQTLVPNVPVPQKAILVVNRSAQVDVANTSEWGFLVDAPLRPSTGVFAPTAAGGGPAEPDLYVQDRQDSQRRGREDSYIPATFELYAASNDVANLYQSSTRLPTKERQGSRTTIAA